MRPLLQRCNNGCKSMCGIITIVLIINPAMDEVVVMVVVVVVVVCNTNTYIIND